MNTAARILRVLDCFHADNTSTACSGVWLSFLSRHDPTASLTQRQVTSVVLVFLDEVEHVKDRLSELAVPEELFTHAISSVENAFQPTQLNSAWNQLRGNLGPEVMMAWRWCAWYMNGTETKEDELSAEALERLNLQLHALKEIQKDPGLPLGLRRALDRQIESLERALQLYALVGASALEEAYTKTSGILLTVDVSDAEINANNAGAIRTMMTAFKETAAAVGKTAVFVKEGVETISFFQEGVQKLIELAK